MHSDPNEAARLLRLHMERHGLSQVDVAASLKQTPGFVSRLLSGQKKPGRRTAEAARVAFKIPPLAWDEEPSRPKRKPRRTVRQTRQTNRQSVS
jgi:transcriptional regulator with XRE-family HTH domain